MLLLGAVLSLSGCYKEVQKISPGLVKGGSVSVDFATPGIGSETEIVGRGADGERDTEVPVTRAVTALDEDVTVRIIAYRS